MTSVAGTLLILIGAVAPTAYHVTTSAQQTKSQCDGIYTVAQAKRGESIYTQHCSTCHGNDLAGGEMAPPLAGPEFGASWNELSIGDFFDRIRISMPQANPGSLSPIEVADVLTFILSKGEFPASSHVELAKEREPLGIG